MLYKLLYVSRATRELSDNDLEDLLTVSRRNNERLNLTGVLVYANGQFLQVLEGEEEPIRRLYNAIRRDDRNSDHRIIARNPVADRMFPSWSMAFQNLDKISMTEFGDLSKMVAKGFSNASATDLDPFLDHIRQLL